jgi:hypothetical protein
MLAAATSYYHHADHIEYSCFHYAQAPGLAHFPCSGHHATLSTTIISTKCAGIHRHSLNASASLKCMPSASPLPRPPLSEHPPQSPPSTPPPPHPYTSPQCRWCPGPSSSFCRRCLVTGLTAASAWPRCACCWLWKRRQRNSWMRHHQQQ